MIGYFYLRVCSVVDEVRLPLYMYFVYLCSVHVIDYVVDYFVVFYDHACYQIIHVILVHSGYASIWVKRMVL